MSETLLVLTVLAPLILAILWPAKQWRGSVGRLIPFVPLTALMLAAFCEDCTVELPWLLLGSRWALEPTARVFLAFTAGLWLTAGFYGRSYLAGDANRDRFELFWLLTMAGNLGLIVSQDMVSFLLFFTLMSVAAYGLIVHDGRPESLRAGRIYIVLAVLGEVFLFWAALIAAHETGSLTFDEVTARLADSSRRNAVTCLLLVGFGIKLGIMPLHFMLPLADPAAPIPGGAVLSGAIIKAGILGWIRFLPVGEVAMDGWGAVYIVLGIASAFLAALIGMTQVNSRTVLAYSSISQMGLASIGFGAALMVPESWQLINAAILLFVAHHAISKAALFLGVGAAQADLRSPISQTLVAVGLVLASASLTGLPLTSGFAAKNALKAAAATTPETWSTALGWILPLTGITTTLLLCRFLYLTWPRTQRHAYGSLSAPMALSWGTLILGIPALVIVLPLGDFLEPKWFSLEAAKLWPAIWPVIGAGIIASVTLAIPGLRSWLGSIRIPAADLLVPVEWLLAWCLRIWNRVILGGLTAACRDLREYSRRYRPPNFSHALIRVEQQMGVDITAGIMVGTLVVVMITLILVGNL